MYVVLWSISSNMNVEFAPLLSEKNLTCTFQRINHKVPLTGTTQWFLFDSTICDFFCSILLLHEINKTRLPCKGINLYIAIVSVYI